MRFVELLKDEYFEEASVGTVWSIHKSDMQMAIRFTRGDGVVVISTTDDHYPNVITVSLADFFPAVRAFVTSFAQALRERVPDFLVWDTFAPLRAYLTEANE